MHDKAGFSTGNCGPVDGIDICDRRLPVVGFDTHSLEPQPALRFSDLEPIPRLVAVDIFIVGV